MLENTAFGVYDNNPNVLICLSVCVCVYVRSNEGQRQLVMHNSTS